MDNRLLVSAAVAVLFTSCSDRNNPTTPVAPIDTPAYLGGIGTQRVYKEVIRWYVPQTDSAFVSVPESLYSEIRLTPEQLRQGIVSISEITHNLDTIPAWYYEYWHLTSPYRAYIHLKGRSTGYDLFVHLTAIAEGRAYPETPVGVNAGYYLEKDDSLVTIAHPYGQSAYLLKPLAVNRSWIRDEHQYFDSNSGIWRSHNTSATIVDKVNVTVEAGTFEAYKLDINHNWPDLGITHHWRYEYYSPNVGLVLEESDAVQHIYTGVPGGPSSTTVVRIVSRRELASVTIIQ